MAEPDRPDSGERPDAPARRRPTVYEVAARAGVSIATVSRALRHDEPVAEDTRQRVLAAARELNWRPSGAARALAGEIHDAVAIVFPDLTGPYYAQVIAGFESEVVRHGKAVMVLAAHGRSAAEQLVRDLARRIDGLVIMDRTIPDETVQQVAAAGIPVILLSRPALPGIPAVRSENVAAAAALTRHLFGHGLRRIQFLGDPARSPDVRERWLGFVQAHAAEDRPLPPEPVRCPGFEPEHGYRAALEIFRGDADVDAIFCANDELASGVYWAAADAGRRVPEDVAVTGWDDVSLAAHLSPRLTTVRQPMADLGGTAARLLFEQIAARDVASTVLATELVIRESCGCEGGRNR